MEWFVGRRVRAKLSPSGGGITVSGEVFAADETCLTLLHRSVGGEGTDVRVVQARFVESVEVIETKGQSPGTLAPPVETPLPAIDKVKVLQRELKALENEKELKATLAPPAVQKAATNAEHAQSVFDALRKTLPVVWDRKDGSIRVFESVVIAAPSYDKVSGAPANEVGRVQVVLDGERQKLGL